METIDKIVSEISSLDKQALATLEEFYAQQVYEDDLHKDYLCWKSAILLQTGNLDESFICVSDLLSIITEQDHRYVNALHTKISVLVNQDKLHDAEENIIRGLKFSNKNPLQRLSFLQVLLSSKIKNEINPLFIPFIDSLVSDLGVPLNQKITPIEKINQLVKMTIESNRNYSLLLTEVNANLEKEAIVTLVKSYIESEKLEYYRNLAKDYLDSL